MRAMRCISKFSTSAGSSSRRDLQDHTCTCSLVHEITYGYRREFSRHFVCWLMDFILAYVASLLQRDHWMSTGLARLWIAKDAGRWVDERIASGG
jgi:hypothetical protein